MAVDFEPAARIGDVQHGEAARAQPVGQSSHRSPGANQPVNHDDDLALHGRKVFVAPDLRQRRFTFLQRAPRPPHIAAVQQPTMPREGMFLNTPVVKADHVAPKLHSPGRGRRDVAATFPGHAGRRPSLCRHRFGRLAGSPFRQPKPSHRQEPRQDSGRYPALQAMRPDSRRPQAKTEHPKPRNRREHEAFTVAMVA